MIMLVRIRYLKTINIMKIFARDNKGFTLIELLVVISIIGLLSSVILASLNSARAKARDSQRVQSIHQVQTALELYYDDNGFYPLTSSGAITFPTTTPLDVLTSALTPSYISKIPASPSGTAYSYFASKLGYQNPGVSPATFYAIYMPYETKTICYVCGGSSPSCSAGQNYWGKLMCQ